MSKIEALIVGFDYGSTGLWYHFGDKDNLLSAYMADAMHHGLPEDLGRAIKDWNYLFASLADLSNKERSCYDSEKVSVSKDVADCFLSSGLYLAKEVKKHWDKYVYYYYYSDNPKISQTIKIA